MTSRSIGQPLPDDALDSSLGTLFIIDAQRRAVVVPEIKLGEIAMKMLFADVLINAIDTTLQDREEVFCGVGGCVAAHVLISRVIDSAVAGEPLANLPIHSAFVGPQVRGFVDTGFQDRPQVRGIHLRYVARTDTAIAFNQRYNRLL